MFRFIPPRQSPPFKLNQAKRLSDKGEKNGTDGKNGFNGTQGMKAPFVRFFPSDVLKTVSPTSSYHEFDKPESLFEGETVTPFYIGVDFHPHQQTVAWIDPVTGEIKTQQLLHNTPAVRSSRKAGGSTEC